MKIAINFNQLLKKLYMYMQGLEIQSATLRFCMKHESNISISILQSLDITYATIQHGA